jgi:Raf kinase inhibitor-like YbhB/YbcL family protein
MKLLRNIVIVILLLLLISVAVIILRASGARDADARFHRSLTRSLALRSEGFSAGGTIPAQYTCKGAGGSPQISWSDVPPRTASLALIAIDWDVPSPAFRLFGFTHWTLYDMAPALLQLDAGVSVNTLADKGAKSGLNSGGSAGFTPPCPPAGIHKYIFRIYALDVPQLQPASPDHDGIIAAMKGHVLGYGELSAFYSK